MTVDIARLYVYKDKDLLASIESKKLEKNIPQHLRSPDNTWFGLSKRSRVIVVSKDSDALERIKRIEDLSDLNGREKFVQDLEAMFTIEH